MKKSMNFYAPMWLLVLGLAFGLWACDKRSEGEPKIFDPIGEVHFALVDSSANNICKTKENSPYNVDEIYIVMHDGTRVSDLRYYTPKQGQNDSNHPAYKGLVFASDFLHAQAAYKGSKYADKPFYLVLNEEDTDTLMWKSEEEWLFHNGEKAGLDTIGGSPYMLVKGNF
ncbi:MAG: hypothetical protein COZ18_12945 [Flexibacter sp. CG_4_10_14_3_um_filter_32_15]|nr:MAG: hypothetical protein COZ18_12945 [Flexibacter sp. CG_4_10_14_3_um_filter_32_15]